jgi:translation initiation factor 6 (eIF-6)
MRRSSRVPITLPIAVTSLEPSAPFSEICETLVVSAHGCAIFSPTRLEAGIPVQFRRKGGGAAKAHVVDCKPMGSGQHGWQLAAKLDQPENFWGLESCPEDWGRLLEIHSDDPQPRKLPRSDKAQPSAPGLKIVSEKGHAQLTEYDMRTIVAEFVQPLHAEVVALKEKVAQGDGKRSKFDISLSHIPPEVEEKLWVRLREDLGTQVLKQTQEQSAQVLGSAQTMIEQNIVRALEGFRQQVTQQLQTVQQNAQGLSEEIAEAVGQHFNSNAEKFQKQVADAGARAQHQSEEHFRSLQQRLGQEHDAYRREMQKAQDTVSAESSRLQTQVTALGSRIVQLDDTACRLESGMETRLSQMASDQISAARVQLETAVDVVLKELGTRNAKELDRQLDDARGKLKIVQKGIETSVSDLVKTEVAASLLSFGQAVHLGAGALAAFSP